MDDLASVNKAGVMNTRDRKKEKKRKEFDPAAPRGHFQDAGVSWSRAIAEWGSAPSCSVVVSAVCYVNHGSRTRISGNRVALRFPRFSERCESGREFLSPGFSREVFVVEKEETLPEKRTFVRVRREFYSVIENRFWELEQLFSLQKEICECTAIADELFDVSVDTR